MLDGFLAYLCSSWQEPLITHTQTRSCVSVLVVLVQWVCVCGAESGGNQAAAPNVFLFKRSKSILVSFPPFLLSSPHLRPSTRLSLLLFIYFHSSSSFVLASIFSVFIFSYTLPFCFLSFSTSSLPPLHLVPLGNAVPLLSRPRAGSRRSIALQSVLQQLIPVQPVTNMRPQQDC